MAVPNCEFQALGNDIKRNVAPSLESVSDYACRVERLAYNVERFNERFFVGASPEAEPDALPVPSGHIGQLLRLRDAIERLDTAVLRLGEIG